MRDWAGQKGGVPCASQAPLPPHLLLERRNLQIQGLVGSCLGLHACRVGWNQGRAGQEARSLGPQKGTEPQIAAHRSILFGGSRFRREFGGLGAQAGARELDGGVAGQAVFGCQACSSGGTVAAQHRRGGGKVLEEGRGRGRDRHAGDLEVALGGDSGCRGQRKVGGVGRFSPEAAAAAGGGSDSHRQAGRSCAGRAQAITARLSPARAISSTATAARIISSRLGLGRRGVQRLATSV